MKQLPRIIKGISVLIILAAILLLADRNLSSSREKKITIIEIDYNLSTTSEATHAGIIDGFKAGGFSEGVQYELKRYNAQGDVATLSSIIDVVNSIKADLIFTVSTPTTQAAIKKIKNTPVVFALVGDPVGIGAGTSFTDHLPNYTGVSVMSDFEGAIAVLKRLKPGLKRIGTLFCPAESNSVEYKKRLEAEASRNGILLISMPVSSTSDVPDALLALFMDHIEILTQISDNLTNTCGETIMRMANDHQVPSFAFVSAQVKVGAFGALSRDYYQNGVDASALAIKVLKGESPKNIPFEMVSRTNLMFNKKMLDTYGISLPDDIKAKATMIDN